MSIFTTSSRALTILLGAGMSAIGLGASIMPSINFDPPKRRRGGNEYPHSSTRQHRRHAAKTYERKMPNGQVVMQTLPAVFRRNAFEVDCVLDGRLQLQVVDA